MYTRLGIPVINRLGIINENLGNVWKRLERNRRFISWKYYLLNRSRSGNHQRTRERRWKIFPLFRPYSRSRRVDNNSITYSRSISLTPHPSFIIPRIVDPFRCIVTFDKFRINGREIPSKLKYYHTFLSARIPRVPKVLAEILQRVAVRFAVCTVYTDLARYVSGDILHVLTPWSQTFRLNDERSFSSLVVRKRPSTSRELPTHPLFNYI